MINLGNMNRLNVFLSLLFFFSIECSFSQSEKQLIEKYKKCKNINQEVQFGSELISFYSNNNSKKREEIIGEFKKINTESLNITSKNLLNLILAEEYLSKNNLDDFNAFFRSKLLNVVFKDPLLQHRKYILQFYFEFFNQNENYAKTLQNDISLTLKSRKNKLISEAYQNLAQAHTFRLEKDSALYYASKAIDFAKRSDSKITLALSFKNTASIYSFFNDFRQALLKELTFLEYAKELNNDYLKAIAYQEIAVISMKVGNFSEGTIYFKRATQLSNEIISEFDKAILNIGLAKNNYNLDNISAAKNNLGLAERTLKKHKSNDYLAKTILLRGLVENNPNNAINYFLTALRIFEKSKSIEGIIESSHYLGIAYKKLKNLKQADFYFKKSLELSKKVNEQGYFSTENVLQLANILALKGQINEAFKLQKIIIDLTHENTVRKEAVKIAQLTESNLREEREQLIELQKQSIEKEKKLKERLENQRTKNFLITGFIAALLVLGIVILFLRMNQIHLRQEQREAEMSQTLLRTQMNPHFVFNAMSAIQSYIFTHNPERSSKFLVNFSKLMRLILENSPKEFIPLELEEEILEKYLNTQKMRFEDRFDYEIYFDENLLFKKALVPPMITQPFVENAIEHGQLHTVQNGKITISATEENGSLLIIIRDNGIGRKHSAMTQKIKKHKSMAIDITRERISIINRKYKTEGSLTFEDNDKANEKGTIVKILLPLQFEK